MISRLTRSWCLMARGGAFCLLLASIAAPGGALAQSLKHDKTKPIEISADSLEVEQENQVATFIGNVDAVQGDLVLSADTLKVHYEGGGEAAGVGLAAGGSGAKISEIEAAGGVILSSPGETAEGDVGVYDVAQQQITLEGAVVLTRGENVLRGARLVLDLATGKSRLTGSTAVAEDGTGDGRVKALFTPKDKGSDNEQGAANGDVPPLPEAKPK